MGSPWCNNFHEVKVYDRTRLFQWCSFLRITHIPNCSIYCLCVWPSRNGDCTGLMKTNSSRREWAFVLLESSTNPNSMGVQGTCVLQSVKPLNMKWILKQATKAALHWLSVKTIAQLFLKDATYKQLINRSEQLPKHAVMNQVKQEVFCTAIMLLTCQH